MGIFQDKVKNCYQILVKLKPVKFLQNIYMWTISFDKFPIPLFADPPCVLSFREGLKMLNFIHSPLRSGKLDNIFSIFIFLHNLYYFLKIEKQVLKDKHIVVCRPKIKKIQNANSPPLTSFIFIAKYFQNHPLPITWQRWIQTLWLFCVYILCT